MTKTTKKPPWLRPEKSESSKIVLGLHIEIGLRQRLKKAARETGLKQYEYLARALRNQLKADYGE